MKKFLLVGFFLAALVIPSHAQNTRVGSDCSQGLTWTWGADDLGRQLSIDTKGRLCVNGGGEYNSTLPTLTNTQRGAFQLGTRGALHTHLMAPDSATPIAGTTPADGVSNTGTSLRVWTVTNLFNGSTWDRAFTCTSTAVVNVTAGATTEIIALTASQTIRICSIAVSMSAAGTMTLTSGTGTNCGTGATPLSGAMALATGTPMELSAPAGGSLLRPAVSNAFCITAATGNVTGFVTYAKF